MTSLIFSVERVKQLSCQNTRFEPTVVVRITTTGYKAKVKVEKLEKLLRFESGKVWLQIFLESLKITSSL